MPLAEYLEGQKSAQPPVPPTDSAAKLRKQVFLQGGVMIALGLLLAGWYVGYRVVTTRSAHPPAPVQVIQPVPKKIVVAPQPAPQPVEPKPVPLPTPVIPVVPVSKPAPPAAGAKVTRHDASPRTGEKYLQIAAFGPRALDGFLKTLEGQGLHPLVAPGPVDNIYRILVGPFPNATALDEARSLIKTSGVEPILRTY
jgi:hypothetical protein